MVLEYTTSDKDEPQAIPTGSAPTFAADISEFSSWLADGRTYRRAATQAALIALTGMDDNDLGIVDNIDGGWFRYDGSVPIWQMHGLPRFATVAARDAAITVPRSGMRAIAAGCQFVYVSSWRLAEVPRFADATARDAALTAPALGDLAVLTSDEVTYRYNGSAWKAWNSDWLTWTPTVTGWIGGTGKVETFKYRWVEGWALFDFRLKRGSSGATAATPILTLPFTARQIVPNFTRLDGTGNIWNADDTGVPFYLGYLLDNASATTVSVRYITTTAQLGALTTTVPITFATNDEVAGQFWVEPA